MHRTLSARLLTVTLSSMLLILPSLTMAAEAPGNPAFERTWARTDRPVDEGSAARTWMWGPEAFAEIVTEEYAESLGGVREVQYYDKCRVEINLMAARSRSRVTATTATLMSG